MKKTDYQNVEYKLLLFTQDFSELDNTEIFETAIEHGIAASISDVNIIKSILKENFESILKENSFNDSSLITYQLFSSSSIYQLHRFSEKVRSLGLDVTVSKIYRITYS